MGFFQNPVGNDPYKGYKAENIQGERKRREPFPQLPSRPPPKKPFFLVAWLRHLYSRISLLFSGSEPAIQNLLLIREIFETMKKEDRSQDSELLKQFSLGWENIHRDLHLLQKKSIPHQQLMKWVSEVESYPEGHPFTLGYYLNEHAGEPWLPFPYMEMIQRLHSQHQKNPDTSFLNQWVESLSALILLLHAE